jgi:hypothetical protein
MGKKHMRGKHRKGSSTRTDVANVNVHCIIGIGASGGAANWALNPYNTTLFPRLNTLCQAYAQYRVMKLKYRILPNGSGSTVLTYYPTTVSSAPTTSAAIMESPNAIGKSITQTVPTQWHSVPRVQLAGPYRWYDTQSASGYIAQPGFLYAYASSTQNDWVEVVAKYQFQMGDAIAVGLHPTATTRPPEVIPSAALPALTGLSRQPEAVRSCFPVEASYGEPIEFPRLVAMLEAAGMLRRPDRPSRPDPPAPLGSS